MAKTPKTGKPNILVIRGDDIGIWDDIGMWNVRVYANGTMAMTTI